CAGPLSHHVLPGVTSFGGHAGTATGGAAMQTGPPLGGPVRFGAEDGSARREALVALVLEEVVEVPALDLIHHLVELRVWDRLVDEALAAAELREVPFVIG